jgi:hypothetical protein
MPYFSSSFLRKQTVYRILMGLAIWFKDTVAWSPTSSYLHPTSQLYLSVTSWALAVGINLLGLALNITAVSGKFK